MPNKFRLKYNNQIIADNLDLESIYSKTLPCFGKLMSGNLVLESYNPIPTSGLVAEYLFQNNYNDTII